MAEEMEFVDGLIAKAPHEKAPDFVKANLSIKVEQLAKWLQGKAGQEWVNVDVKVSKGGKWYASVSNYKKEEAKVEHRPNPKGDDGSVAGMADEIPF